MLLVVQCAFYFVNFTMDTTLGVVLNWAFLCAFSHLAVSHEWIAENNWSLIFTCVASQTRFQWTSVMTPGDYGNPIRVW